TCGDRSIITVLIFSILLFFFQAEDGIRDRNVTGVQTCALPIYPVLAGGVAVSRSPSGTVKNMIQLMPVMIDKVGAASVMSGSTRYETADDMQVYLWYRGQYYPTTLAQVNPAEYHLIGWYDNLGCTAGNKIRVLVAVKKD